MYENAVTLNHFEPEKNGQWQQIVKLVLPAKYGSFLVQWSTEIKAGNDDRIAYHETLLFYLLCEASLRHESVKPAKQTSNSIGW